MLRGSLAKTLKQRGWIEFLTQHPALRDRALRPDPEPKAELDLAEGPDSSPTYRPDRDSLGSQATDS